ncbi:MAG: protein rep [Oscillospiraceae bacterium]|nr:protein rep [Oscillospiraceae bacterium]
MNQVKEVKQRHMANVYRNAVKNREIMDYLIRMGVEMAVAKAPRYEREKLFNKINRMENCNKFWTTETHEASHIKLLLHTYLCKDKFCCNCKRVKQHVMENRYLPYMEIYRNLMYHAVLTVPACSGKKLKETIQHMAECFKTLVTYLNGNKIIQGINFGQYGYQGCIRSLEIKYNSDKYQPHYHVSTVFDNTAVIENKNINNMFSDNGERLFSEFESMLQRVWFLLINRQRLTYKSIFAETAEQDRYSCIIDKFEANDYDKLFGYMVKNLSEDNEFMEYDNFRTLYYALNRVRQIQGYGIFYNVTATEDDPDYTEQEYQDIADFIASDEPPVIAYEPLSRLAKNTTYTYLKKQYRRQGDIIK